MKSHINYLADYHDAPIDKEVTIPYPHHELGKKLKAVARTGKKVISPGTIEAGDVAVLDLESELAKFNRKSAFVTVCGGLLDEEFERSLIGLAAGSCSEASAGGVPVKVTVKQISRTIYPEPDDDMVRAYASSHDDFAGISTLEQYKERVIDDYFTGERENVYYGKLDEVLEYLLTSSDLDFDSEELAIVRGWYMDTVQEELEEQGKSSLEDMSEAALMSAFEAGSAEEVLELIESSAERDIATSLISAALNGEDTSGMPLNEVMEKYYTLQPIEEYLEKTLIIKEER